MEARIESAQITMKIGEKPQPAWIEPTELLPMIAAGFGARFGKTVDIVGTRRATALLLGISTSTLQRYIGDEAMPPFDTCARLCKRAAVRMEWLAFDHGAMHEPEYYIIPPRDIRESQTARHSDAKLDSGLLHSAVRITEETLKKFGLRDQLDSIQKADLVQIVFNDLARGAADDAALASLGRILAINRKP